MDLEGLLSLETQVWQALVDGDAAADARLLADDFVGVYPTGITGGDEHVAQLAHGPTVATFELSEARMIAVSAAARLLVYRAAYTRPGDDPTPESMFVSSLWCRRNDDRRGDRWVNVFSQDTPDTGIAVV